MSSNREKADVAEREVRYRERVYPRLIAGNKMSVTRADREIAVMAEIALFFRALADADADADADQPPLPLDKPGQAPS